MKNTRDNLAFLKSRGAFSHGNLQLHQFDQFHPILSPQLKFGFVVDDGFHSAQAVLATFEAFLPRMVGHWVYVVEDCRCAEFRSTLESKYSMQSLVQFQETNRHSQLIVIRPATPPLHASVSTNRV